MSEIADRCMAPTCYLRRIVYRSGPSRSACVVKSRRRWRSMFLNVSAYCSTVVCVRLPAKNLKLEDNASMAPVKRTRKEMELLPIVYRWYSRLTVELSEKGKMHDKAAKVYNSQAADFVFRTNNAKATPDEIDLHGLYDPNWRCWRQVCWGGDGSIWDSH